MPLDYSDMRQRAARVEQLSPLEFKTLEQRARRAAKRQGLQLQRSRRLDPHAPDYGLYRVVDAKGNTPVVGGEAEAYSLTLADVVDRLLGGGEVPGGEVVELVGADGKPAPTLVRGRPR